MKNLQYPPIEIEGEDIYKECAQLFTRKHDIKNSAMKYIADVKRLSNAYQINVPKNISKMKFPTIGVDDSKNILKLYEQKFAKQGEKVNRYYNAILTNGDDTCPICGVGKRKNLDHFLPKSLYPLLCVTPLNLIPICRDCNFDKSNKFSTNYYDIPFNPYFDKVNCLWMKCKIDFSNNRCIPKFYVGLDNAIDPQMYRKCEAHITYYRLNETFQNAATNQIENVKGCCAEVYKECGRDGLKKYLIREGISYKSYDNNSWRYALYCALLRQLDDFCKYV